MYLAELRVVRVVEVDAVGVELARAEERGDDVVGHPRDDARDRGVVDGHLASGAVGDARGGLADEGAA